MNKAIGSLFVFILLASCSVFSQSAEDELISLNIDREYFETLDACQQIMIYVEVGSRHVDIDHAVVIVPQWMNSAIKDNPPNIVADCIYQEGKKQLVLLETNPEQREEISLSIHALVYKAYDLNLLDAPDVHEFLGEVVCRNDIINVGRLRLLIYINEDGLPADYTEPGWQERMVSELCS